MLGLGLGVGVGLGVGEGVGLGAGGLVTNTSAITGGEDGVIVHGVIGTIAFPRPGDGVGVEVNYPFVFHAPAR